MLKDLKCKITYPATPTVCPIAISGGNNGPNQHQILIEDCFIETSHQIEIFNIFGITSSTDSIIQFNGVNDFKNNKALILATGIVPTNIKFINSRAASIRHDFNVLSVNTNISIYNDLGNYYYTPNLLVINNNVSGTYNINWLNDTYHLTITAATSLIDINLPPVGITKTITLYISGDFPLSLPAGWSTFITGEYIGTASMNKIVAEFINTGIYNVSIYTPD